MPCPTVFVVTNGGKTMNTTKSPRPEPEWFDNFRAVQLEFAEVAQRLQETWKDGGEFVDSYPFNQSFDELVLGIWEWHHESQKK
jgi:hypothetical protein